MRVAHRAAKTALLMQGEEKKKVVGWWSRGGWSLSFKGVGRWLRGGREVVESWLRGG